MDRAERDLGRHAEPEGEQDERVERDLGDRVDGNQHRLHHVARQAMQAEPEPDSEPERDRDGERGRKGAHRLRQVRPERFGHHEVRGEADGRERRAHRHLAGEPIETLPGEQEPDDQDEAVAHGFESFDARQALRASRVFPSATARR